MGESSTAGSEEFLADLPMLEANSAGEQTDSAMELVEAESQCADEDDDLRPSKDGLIRGILLALFLGALASTVESNREQLALSWAEQSVSSHER